MLETWELSPLEPSTTHFLSRLHFFQKHTVTCAFKIAGGVEPSSSSRGQAPAPASASRVPTDFAAKVTKTFFDCATALLDGLLQLANEESPVQLPEKFTQNAEVGYGVRATLDFTDPVC